MSVPSASYSVTMRVALENHSRIGAVTTAVGDAGGAVTALDVVDPNGSSMTIDLTCNAVDEGRCDEAAVQRGRRVLRVAVAPRGDGEGVRRVGRAEFSK